MSVTADLHLDQQHVPELRGVTPGREHAHYLIEQLDALPQRSTLWLLGDLERGSNRAYTLERLQQVKQHRELTMHLLAGNHDARHPMHRRSATRQREYFHVFESVHALATIRHNRRDISLSHLPYTGDHTADDRSSKWLRRDYGAPLIHGHTHQDTPTVRERPNQVCVSWEAWHRPASLNEVLEQFTSVAASSSWPR